MNRVEEEEWIQPPSSSPPPHTSDEIDLIKPGRLTIKCIQGESIRRKDAQNAKTTLNPSIRFTLAPACSNPLQLESTQQQRTNENPNFHNEILNFDIHNPRDYISNNNDIRLRVELLDQPLLQREILGEIEISVVRFLASKKHSSSTSSHHTERLPILQPGDSSSNSFIILEFSFIPVHEGTLCVTLLECKDLPNMEATDDAPGEIICTIQIGGESSKDSQPIMQRTGNPKFPQGGEKIYLEINKDNWFNELGIEVTTNTANGYKIGIGQGNTPVPPIIGKFSSWNYDGNDTEEKDTGEITVLPLKRTKDGKEFIAGTILASFKFLIAGKLTVSNIHCNVEEHITLTNTNVQLNFKTKGRASTLVQTSSLMNSSSLNNSSIDWKDEEIELYLVDHHSLELELNALDAMETRHDLVGAGQLSILSVFRRGHMDITTVLKAPNEVGNLMKVGEARFSLKFEGNGLSYPKLHPSATVTNQTEGEEQGQVPKKKKLTTAQQIVSRGKEVAASVTEIFSDDDIKLGFKFLDLDKNGYIGAAELKHVLICMGELITDEEIDAMIDILDKNGDGQVGFDEFSTMGKSANFGYESMSTDSIVSKDTIRSSDDGYDMKRSVFSRFVINNKIHRGVINACREFLNQKRNAALSEVSTTTSSVEEVDFTKTLSIWKIDYASMCRIMSVKPTGESRKVFELLLDSDVKEKIDARHLILGLVNFIPTFSVHERCQMMLEMYDVKRSDTINFGDLLDILASNHLKSRDSVNRKAKTVMKFVDQAGTGKLVFDDLLDAATKFPNLLLPKHMGV